VTVRPGVLDTTQVIKDIIDRIRRLETTAASSVVIRSPNGSRWRVTVADDGTLGTTAL